MYDSEIEIPLNINGKKFYANFNIVVNDDNTAARLSDGSYINEYILTKAIKETYDDRITIKELKKLIISDLDKYIYGLEYNIEIHESEETKIHFSVTVGEHGFGISADEEEDYMGGIGWYGDMADGDCSYETWDRILNDLRCNL
jgi:hypothetical protein